MTCLFQTHNSYRSTLFNSCLVFQEMEFLGLSSPGFPVVRFSRQVAEIKVGRYTEGMIFSLHAVSMYWHACWFSECTASSHYVTHFPFLPCCSSSSQLLPDARSLTTITGCLSLWLFLHSFVTLLNLISWNFEWFTHLYQTKVDITQLKKNISISL